MCVKILRTTVFGLQVQKCEKYVGDGLSIYYKFWKETFFVKGLSWTNSQNLVNNAKHILKPGILYFY